MLISSIRVLNNVRYAVYNYKYQSTVLSGVLCNFCHNIATVEMCSCDDPFIRMFPVILFVDCFIKGIAPACFKRTIHFHKKPLNNNLIRANTELLSQFKNLIEIFYPIINTINWQYYRILKWQS